MKLENGIHTEFWWGNLLKNDHCEGREGVVG